MRQFAAECLRWSEQTDNASQRDLMIRIAQLAAEVDALKAQLAAQKDVPPHGG